MKHIPRKRFGQHFLVDGGLIDEIVTHIAPKTDDLLVEIGPGLGALTLPLLAKVPRFTVVELDRDLAAHWRKDGRVDVVEADVLTVGFDFDRKAPGVHALNTSGAIQNAAMRVVGNLPYNISTPILFHLLRYASHIADQHFMLQREVIDRMVAKPATSAYGRLSIALQWRYEMENLMLVPPHAFDPPPRVMSAVVRMVPRAMPAALEVAKLETLVRIAFSQRRKLMRHTLGQWLEQQQFSGQFDCQRRAEEVPVDEYIALAQALSASTPQSGGF